MKVSNALPARLAVGVLSVATLMVATDAMAQRAQRRARTAAASVATTPINRVAFEGNSKLKSVQIAPEMNLQDRGAFTAEKAQQDVERIREIYRRNGRGAANVSYRIVNLPNGKIDVVYTIDEGDKTGIREIRFVGNSAYSDSKLRGLMQSTEMNYLSWLKTSDVYDADRIAADQELIRRYYLRRGYADFRIVSTDVQFDAARGGYFITMTVDEGPQYRVGAINVDSRLAGVDAAALNKLVRLSSGDVYDGSEMERTLEDLTREAARRGYAFAQVRPRGDRAGNVINLSVTVDDGPRLYIERINIRGNTRTRDYVIRREFDVGEGDAYNRILLDRAERRLNNLGYFKKVRITNEPGTSPDRVVVNVDVEDQATGSFAISGGYSTADGFLAELSVTESNFLGRGQFVRFAVSNGQNSRGFDFSFTEPYFMDRRIAAGFDIFHKQTDNSKYARYEHWVTGGTIRFGIPLTEELTVAPRWSVFSSRIKIPNKASKPYNDCSFPVNGATPGYGTLAGVTLSQYYSCLSNGEASLAVKESAGSRLTSMPGYSLLYNSLDSTKLPTRGIYAEFKQDFAGAGGDSRFIRTTGDVRVYRELFDDVVGFVRLQGGNITAFGGKKLQIVDNFNLGPSLVRGFAPSGIGPRDISNPYDTKSNPLGGTTYFGGTVEVQFPIWGMPRELGLKGAIFADAGTLFGYKGTKDFSSLLNLPLGTPCFATNVAPNYTQGNCITVADDRSIRSSVGASILWASPLGPIRFDWAYPISKGKYDVTQFFRFSGGTSF